MTQITKAALLARVEALEKALADSLEQQTATSEILRAISSSPTDLQPVLDTVVRSAARFCGAYDACIFRLDRDHLRLDAHHGPVTQPDGFRLPMKGSVGGRTVLERRVIHVADLPAETVEFPEAAANARRLGFRAILSVPLVREGVTIGAIQLRRPESVPFTDKQVSLLQTFADQAVIAIENVRLFNETKEALEQQTATSEILSVIASSPTDLQPVMDAVVTSASRLADADHAMIGRAEGGFVRWLATNGPLNTLGTPITRDLPSGRAILDRQTTQIEDIAILTDEFPAVAKAYRELGVRTILATPLILEGAAIGVLLLRRRDVRPFTDRQIALVQTFADQAVIAIENVRLFNETKDALERQTATSEILRVISTSPTDVQPVFDTIVRSAVRLCDGLFSALHRFDGELLHLAAHHNYSLEALEAARRLYPARPSRGQGFGRAILERAVVHIPDVEVDPEYQAHALSRAIGFRSGLFVPMQREGDPIGAIMVARAEPGPFSDNEIALLKTFADQAVIAIENVRLFKELEARNRDLTATSQILQVISRSPTDVQPVFDTIVQNARALCGADSATVFTYDGEQIQLESLDNANLERADALRQAWPRPANRGHATGRAILTGRPVHIPDVREDPEFALDALRDTVGLRSLLSVPMVRDGIPIGAITVQRWATARPFSDNQIDLLKTFADQAVIAIENVRLFTELEAKNQALTQAHATVTDALEQQTATSEILRVISSSPTDVQPTFEAIAASSRRLCEAAHGMVFRFDGDLVHLAAHDNLSTEQLDAVRSVFPIRPGRGSVTARAILTRSLVHVRDRREDPELEYSALSAKFPNTLSVPLLREGVPLGAITVTKAEVGRFSDGQITLLQTFADQAVIAIENVRLFKELEARNRDLTATSDILQVIASSPTDLEPVFESIVRSAARVCDATDATLAVAERHEYRISAHYGPIPLRPVGSTFPIGSGTVMGRTILEGKVYHVEDLSTADAFPQGQRLALELGQRATLCVPLLREGASIGTIMLRRAEAQLFTERQVTLLKTFADQAVIAIENVRLFKELDARNRDLTEALEQQTATSDVLKAISHSALDLTLILRTVAESATKLCGAQHGHIFRFDGEVLRYAVGYGTSPELTNYFAEHPVPLGPGSTSGTAASERHTVQVHDVLALPGYQFGEAARLEGWRTVLAVPMLKERALLGTITIWKTKVEPFTDRQIALVETFADQAVIAIENVRLFKELEGRTSELTRSVEQLTALGEVGRTVSSTLDLPTVLNTIVARAVELSAGHGGLIYEYDETTQEFDVIRGSHHLDDELAQLIRAAPIRLGEGVAGKAAALGVPVQVPDIRDEGAYDVARIRTVFQRRGYRSLLAIPLLLEQQIIGVLVVWRQEPGRFAPEVVNLLQTFGTQSALAIQNARLFRELADKSRQLEAASQHKSEFLANMSHELRTPLNAIIGFSEVLAEKMFGDINDKQAEYLQDILESGRHLLSLINDILDLSKIEAGRMELELAEFDLPQAIENALTLVRERALRRGIALHHAIDDRVADIRADERKVKQVLLNLLANAIKFTPEGGRIDVRAAPADGLVEVSVTDTGVGIAPEDQGAVFEEFRQVGATDTRAEGTGLGLALSRKFIELHGGKISVQSEIGHGSTFTFTLPVRP